ncbi:hypothetical protein GURASL_27810 [Geotalea uraniireducens]|uniref:DUF948 domain-containing protein n=1 Tax=Geotalea uraniireducens TaxID=351604 RepID=A0ABM8EMP8_9BACT|nr:DUF948 domain-containing protein [Geotalea uraniireducens]BDV43858.1 hypothetical protein GURASL_27810 [Geotalea uraniireducens]
MTIAGIAVVIMAVALVVLVAFMIPTLIEIRKAALGVQHFAEQTRLELKPVISELERTVADLKIVTQGVAARVDDVQTFMEAVGDTGRNIRTINSVISSVASLAATSSVWMTGARVAGKFLAERIAKKRG